MVRKQILLATGLVLLVACATDVQAGELSNIPANKWTQLPGGAVNSYANPMYDPATKTMVVLKGNGTAHLDVKTGKWEVGLAPAGGTRAGDQPLMKHYVLKNGRPNYQGMLLYHMTAWDSNRKLLVAGATGFMASYDPAAKKWTDLGAKVDLLGKKHGGVPPVAWGSMCYDPVNDQIVMLSGGGAYNFDHWAKHKEVTGAFGTYIFDPKTKLWTRPQIGAKHFYAARDLIRPMRIALQDEMSRTGEAIVLERNGKGAEAKKLVASQADALKKLAISLRGLSGKVNPKGGKLREDVRKRMAAAEDKIRKAAGALKTSGSPEDVYRAEFAAYKLLVAARDEDLWSHPHPRCLSRMVYLPEEKHILLFGGTDGYQQLNDTWAYDCAKREWTKRNPKTLPRPREMHVMAYDSKLKKAVMAGGYKSFWALKKDELREVWTYDFKADDWKLVLNDFPFKRGCASYFGEYHAATGALVVVRNGKDTFALKLVPGGALPAPKTEAFPKPEDKTPFIPPKDDPKTLARWKSMPANTWVAADPSWEPGEYGWGMTGFNGRMNCVVLWGGGHSTHQANDIQLYFPGANKWVTGYPAHRINLAPWNKGCGNPGGVDFRGGVYNLHARRGLGGNGTRALINIQCFGPYFYGPEPFMKQPVRWGKTTTFEFDFFSRRWQLPCPQAGASGMFYPYDAKNTVMAVNTGGAQYFDREKNTWAWASKSKCPTAVNTGEGASNLFIEKKNAVIAVGTVGNKKGPVATWMLDIKTGTWIDLKPKGTPPGRPSALVYCEKDDALFAGCFTGYGKKPLQGQEAVYSFRKNQWITFPSAVQNRVIKKGQRYRPASIGGYHGAWTKIAFSPKHNLIMRHNEGGGMWVMRPEFGKLNWSK